MVNLGKLLIALFAWSDDMFSTKTSSQQLLPALKQPTFSKALKGIDYSF